MKRLFIIRHAKAVARRAGLPDFERPLVKKGVKSARNLAERLKKAGIKPDLFVSSPANRALETAHVFAKEFGYHVQKIQLKDMLYEEATQGALLALVHGLDNARQTVFIFGHNPALQDFGQFLIKDFPGRLPKMGVVGLEFSRNNWKAAGPGAGKLIFFDFPGREAQDERQRSEDLAVQLARVIETTLERADPTALESVRPDVEKVSRKIAGRFLGGSKPIPEMPVEKKKAVPKKLKDKPVPKRIEPKKAEAPSSAEKPAGKKPSIAGPKPEDPRPRSAAPLRPVPLKPPAESRDEEKPRIPALETVRKYFAPTPAPEEPPAPATPPGKIPVEPPLPLRTIPITPPAEDKVDDMPKTPALEAVQTFFAPTLTPQTPSISKAPPKEIRVEPPLPLRTIPITPPAENMVDEMPKIPALEAAQKFFAPTLTPQTPSIPAAPPGEIRVEPPLPIRTIPITPSAENTVDEMPKIPALEAAQKFFAPTLTPQEPSVPQTPPDKIPVEPPLPRRLVYVKPALERKDEGMPEVPTPEAVPDIFPPKLTPDRQMTPRFGDDEPED